MINPRGLSSGRFITEPYLLSPADVTAATGCHWVHFLPSFVSNRVKGACIVAFFKGKNARNNF